MRRQLLWFAVTRNPSAEWLAQQMAEAFPWNTAPTYLVHDNDRAYPANVGHLLGVGRTAHWQDANRMAIGNHALHPVLSFRAEARPHHDLSTGEVLPSDPRCFIPQADEGARATAPTRPDHFPAPSFPTTDRWCYKHRSVPAFVRLLTAASVTLSRDIRHTPISLVFLLRGVICYRLSGGYPLT